MSIIKDKEGFAIRFNKEFFDEETYLNYLNGMIVLLQSQSEDMKDHSSNYYVLCLLHEMMPDHEQVKKMFT